MKLPRKRHQAANCSGDSRASSTRQESVGLDWEPERPLAVKNWVNGTQLTDADRKGKVVLLDFWAVWCGPCIATFPHLREWNEKYADKGLVVIGLTHKDYGFVWDEARNGRCLPRQNRNRRERTSVSLQPRHPSRKRSRPRSRSSRCSSSLPSITNCTIGLRSRRTERWRSIMPCRVFHTLWSSTARAKSN